MYFKTAIKSKLVFKLAYGKTQMKIKRLETPQLKYPLAVGIMTAQEIGQAKLIDNIHGCIQNAQVNNDKFNL